MTTAAQTCCRRSSYYNIRRYDPIGRTMWVRDYFAGYTGQHSDPAPMPCRCSVDIANDRIYVSGPVVWTKENDLRTYWNAACYTVNGNLLWRRRFKFDDTSGGATDVISVSGRHFVLVEQSKPDVSGGPFPVLGNMLLIEFDESGNQLDVGFSLGAADIGPRMLAGDPHAAYNVPSLSNPPFGFTTFGWQGENFGQCGVYIPENDAFVVGVTPDHSGAIQAIVWKTRSPAAGFAGGNGMIERNWIEDAPWAISNNPGDLFGIVTRVWTVPYEMARATGADVICGTDFASYFQFNGDGVSPGVRLGTGSLVRLDSDGNPVWFRGLGAISCLASDDEGRLYAGARTPGDVHPSIQRWTMDGDFMWGHFHNAIEQVAVVGDSGSVTVGNRVKYGLGEKNWIREGSFSG